MRLLACRSPVCRWLYKNPVRRFYEYKKIVRRMCFFDGGFLVFFGFLKPCLVVLILCVFLCFSGLAVE